MAYNATELSNRIKYSFQVAIPKEVVEDSFPHIDSPSNDEMNIAIDASLSSITVK